MIFLHIKGFSVAYGFLAYFLSLRNLRLGRILFCTSHVIMKVFVVTCLTFFCVSLLTPFLPSSTSASSILLSCILLCFSFF